MPTATSIIELIREDLLASIATKQKVMETMLPQIAKAADMWIEALRNGRKILLFGNGGSAADAQHLAAELVGRFAKERRGLPAIALTTDTSILTAIGNDYDYERVFSRQIEALGQPGDVAVGLTTSGNSPNVLAGVAQAKAMGLRTIGFTGGSGGKLVDVAELTIVIPSSSTPRIQESHITIGHIICHIIDENLS